MEINNLINNLKNLSTEDFLALNEKLRSMTEPKKFDAGKILKLIKSLRKLPKISDAAILASECSEESFIRNLHKLQVHLAIMEVIEKSNNSTIQEVLLFGLAELTLDTQVCQEMAVEGKVIPFFLKYLKSQNIALVCYSIKALTTLFMTPFSVITLLKDDEILKTVLSHISNKKFIFKNTLELNGKGVVEENVSEVLGITLRFLVTLGQIPPVQRKLVEMDVVKKLKSVYPKNKYDQTTYQQAMILFTQGEMKDNKAQLDSQIAMEKRIENPSEMVNERTCANCGKLATVTMPLSTCGRCQKAMYCNKECQIDHWKQHKILCSKIKDQSTAQSE